MAQIYSFSPFGYEGSIVSVEVDLRRGIPAFDIIGLAEGATKECRERVRCAISNSGLQFPGERVLLSLSPADIKKEGAGFDLAVALAVLNKTETFINESVMVMGELQLSGEVNAVKGIHAALTTGAASGIEYAIIPKSCMHEADFITGPKVVGVSNLSEAINALKDISHFKKSESIKHDNSVKFNNLENCDKIKLPKTLLRALTIAAAGKHHGLFVGGFNKINSLDIDKLLYLITPLLTHDEALPVNRVNSIAGLSSPVDTMKYTAPFRMPHQTATIEGICGGGPNCRPGEISLAHNGLLFLKEATEFRTYVLQLLRVPIDQKSITLSRAGRSTVFPANFQLLMTALPCPCGNFGTSDKICLCSARSIEMYWKKLSDPLLDRIELKVNLDDDSDIVDVNIEDIRNKVKTAIEIQRSFNLYNRDIKPDQFHVVIKMTAAADKYLTKESVRTDMSVRTSINVRKVALTIANMEGREIISLDDIKEAVKFTTGTWDYAFYKGE